MNVQENQTMTSQGTIFINYYIIHSHGHTIMITTIADMYVHKYELAIHRSTNNYKKFHM